MYPILDHVAFHVQALDQLSAAVVRNTFSPHMFLLITWASCGMHVVRHVQTLDQLSAAVVPDMRRPHLSVC
jgi:hypothetical protein